MELKDLKKAWNTYSSSDANRHQLGEDAIYDMLKKRTRNLIERIDRNIKIGVGILIILTLFFVLDDFFLTPFLAEGIQIPVWVMVIDGISLLFILVTFFYFNLSYRKIKKDYSHSNDLRNVLQSTIHILYFYRRLFYMALFLFLFVFTVSLVSGLLGGVELKAEELGATISYVSSSPIIIQRIILGVVILIVVGAGLFFLFRWGFRKLYGNYISKLKDTLQELDEIE